MSVHPNTKIQSEEARHALARSEVYLFLSRSFAYPREALEPFYHRAQEGVALLGKESLLQGIAIPQPSVLESQYIQLFGHTTPAEYPPYETEYQRAHPFMQSSTLAELASFYHVFGANGASGERIDHLTTELEFMYFLTYRETYAWQSANQEGVSLCREGQRLFLEKHLGQWAPLWCQLLAKQASGFYAQLAALSAHWLRDEMVALEAHPLTLGEEALEISRNGDAFYTSLEEKASCEVEVP